MLTITTSEARLRNLKAVTEAEGGRERFWFTTFARFGQYDVLRDAIWNAASWGNDQFHPLIGQPQASD